MAITGSDKAQLYAMSGIMRSGTSRSNAIQPEVYVSINGIEYSTIPTDAGKYVLADSLSIIQTADESADTASFRTRGFVPQVGKEVIIRLGSTNNLARLFAGYVLSTRKQYVSLAATLSGEYYFDVACIDFTWGMNRLKIIKSYTNQSATTIAQNIISTYCSGFTSTNVAASLPTIDEILFTNEDVTDALTRLANRIGGYWYCDYNKDLHFFQTETGVTNPTTLSSTHVSLSDYRFEQDMSQVVTRVFVEGGGVTALSDLAVGETILPVDDDPWYNPLGGTVVCGAQRITYTGLQLYGAGTVVGPAIQPAAAPTVALAVGAGVTAGAHDYAVTFVTASGETLPGPRVTITTGSVTDPATAILAGRSGFYGYLTLGGSYTYKYTWKNASGETLPSPASTAYVAINTSTGSGLVEAIQAYIPAPTDPSVLAYQAAGSLPLHIYRSVNGGTYRRFGATGVFNLTRQGDNSYVLIDGEPDTAISANPTTPGANDTTANQVAITNVPIGASTVTQRKIYRTEAGGSTLKLQQTIADNTSTSGVTDSTADAGLGAAAPGSDTSAIGATSGNIIPGSTTLLVAGTTAFSSTGGWVIVGSRQILKYTGISGSSLTGIPASGIGSIATAISYNTAVTALAALTGIPASGTGSIQYAIKQGDQVNVLVQINNDVAQSAFATQLGSGDGVQEEYLQDHRLSEPECVARGLAMIGLRGVAANILHATTRDINTRAGRAISSTIDPDYYNAVLADSPIAYWRLGEQSGATTAYDASGSGYSGTYTGSPTLGVTGPSVMNGSDTAATFTGTNYVTMGVDLPRLDFLDVPFSLECWLRKASAPAATQIIAGHLRTIAFPNGYALRVENTGKASFYGNDGHAAPRFQAFSAASVCDDQWHHLVGTWDGTLGANGAKLYVDGVLSGQDTAIGTLGSPSLTFIIGDEIALNKPLIGSVDEVAVYDYELSATDASNHYNASGTYTFKIQRVIIDNFQPTEYPTYRLEASRTRYSFEDLVRQMRRQLN